MDAWYCGTALLYDAESSGFASIPACRTRAVAVRESALAIAAREPCASASETALSRVMAARGWGSCARARDGVDASSAVLCTAAIAARAMTPRAGGCRPGGIGGTMGEGAVLPITRRGTRRVAVSYTHLTLPT